jgi:hypothetical protein
MNHAIVGLFSRKNPQITCMLKCRTGVQHEKKVNMEIRICITHGVYDSGKASPGWK